MPSGNMILSAEWKEICESIVDKLHSDILSDPNNQQRRKDAELWMERIRTTLRPQAVETPITLESVKDWPQDTYLPQGLEGEMPRTAEEVKMGLRLLQWYVADDYQRRTTMDEGDARILTRWAFIRGSLHVVVNGTRRQMKVRETFQELLKFIELKGEGAG